MAAGCVQLAPAGRLGAVEDLGDLGHRPVLEVEEHDDRALLGCQRPDSGQHLRRGRRCLAPVGSRRSISRARSGARCGGVPAAPCGSRFADPQVGSVVAGDFRPVSEQLKKGVLGDLVGLTPIADDVVDGSRHAGELTEEQLLERGRVATMQVVPDQHVLGRRLVHSPPPDLEQTPASSDFHSLPKVDRASWTEKDLPHLTGRTVVVRATARPTALTAGALSGARRLGHSKPVSGSVLEQLGGHQLDQLLEPLERADHHGELDQLPVVVPAASCRCRGP